MSPLWFACEFPERPSDADVMWHYSDCRPCWVKAMALAFQYPDDAHVRWLIGFMEPAS